MNSSISYHVHEYRGIPYNVCLERFEDRCDKCEGTGYTRFSTDADHQEYDRRLDECDCCCGCECVELEESGMEACSRCGGTGEDKGNRGVKMTMYPVLRYVDLDIPDPDQTT